ncbi:MAG TPA: hypothetical protein VNS52_19515, partial [Gemmatimonadaceae bacterium]|nr:hypothetical protein [Gemmatimonadaceae bacterium]
MAQRCTAAAGDIKQLIDAATQKVETGTVLVHQA